MSIKTVIVECVMSIKTVIVEGVMRNVYQNGNSRGRNDSRGRNVYQNGV